MPFKSSYQRVHLFKKLFYKPVACFSREAMKLGERKRNYQQPSASEWHAEVNRNSKCAV